MKKILLIAISVFCVASVLNAQLPDNRPLKLKFGAYNVGHFNQGKLGGYQYPNKQEELQRWKDWIGEQSFDFFIVNEWNHFFDKDSTIVASDELLAPLYNNIYWGKENRWIFNGIATNYKLTNIRQIDWYKDYYSIVGDLIIGKKTITIMSTHIPWQKEGHQDAINALIKEMKKYEYVICLGDMNAANATQLRFQEEGFNIANGGYQGFKCTAPVGRSHGKIDVNIDNIITSKNIKIFNVSAPSAGLTEQDHYPIIADLEITW